MIDEAPVRRRSTARPPVDPLWIVLTPSVDHEAWLKALSKTAANAGRDLVSVSMPPEPRPPKAKPVLYVTDDAAWVADVDPSSVVAIIPQPETAAEMTAALYDMYLPHSMFHASILLAKATNLDPRTRVLTAHQLARNPERIELFPGIVVEPPIAERGSPRPAVATALGMYRLGRPQPRTKVTWSEKLFTYDAKSCIEGAPLGVLDVTGRPRTLLYGPYLALPAGHWKATMRFGIDADAASHELRFDWGHATDFVSQNVTPDAPGIYEIEIDHAVDALGLWQFRILLMEGAFEGRLTFQGGSVERLEALEQAAA